MPDLILLRHGQSLWNKENRFTGWVDIDLSEQGEAEARQAGKLLAGRKIDALFTSVLTRAIRTADLALEVSGHSNLVAQRSELLNERHYGDLQGLNKQEMRQKHGAEQVHTWRRSFDVKPPGKGGESLSMTIDRVLPYYHKAIEPLLFQGKNVLVVAHGNSLRALSYHLDNHSAESIIGLEIPTGVPIVYHLANADGNLSLLGSERLSTDQ